jgi:hypothetical protein
MSTLYYGDDRLAMYIDSVQRTRRVTADRILNEAARWGIARRRASRIIADIIDRTPDAVALAISETPSLPAEIPAIIDGQLAQIESAFSGADATLDTAGVPIGADDRAGPREMSVAGTSLGLWTSS